MIDVNGPQAQYDAEERCLNLATNISTTNTKPVQIQFCAGYFFVYKEIFGW